MTVSNNENIRFVIPSGTEKQFQEKCAHSDQKLSERMNRLVTQGTADELTPPDKLSGILASARAKNGASNLAEPAIDHIDAFIDRVRTERIESGHMS